jgi:hypothetical protein
MGEILPQGTADVIWRNNALKLAEHVLSMDGEFAAMFGWTASGPSSVGAGLPTGVSGDVRSLANNILAAINSWTQSGRSTTQNVGPVPSLVVDQGGRSRQQYVTDAIGPWCRELAEQVYAHIRTRDATRTQAEVAILVTDLVNTINAWLSTTPTAETAGTGSPYNTSL